MNKKDIQLKTSNKIQYFFQSACRFYKDVDIVNENKRFNEKSSDFSLFLLRSRDLDINNKGNIIIIPKHDKAQLNTEVIDKVLFEYPSKWYKPNYINCFNSKIPTHIIQKNYNISILTPNELFELLFSSKLILQCFNENEISIRKNSERFDKIRYINRKIKKVQKENNIIEYSRKKLSVKNELEKWIDQEERKDNNILIIGERGSGKTWLLKRLFLNQYNKHLKNRWINPPAIYIRLQQYGNQLITNNGLAKSISYFIYSNITKNSIAEVLLLEVLINCGGAILLLDGFDEIAKEFTRDDLLRFFRYISDQIPPKAKTIVTSRSTRFNSIEELYNFFTGGGTLFIEKSVSNIESYDPQSQYRTIIPKYTIYEIASFEISNFRNLIFKNIFDSNKKRDFLLNIIDNNVFNQSNEYLLKLSSIPACAQNIIDLVRNENFNQKQILEVSLLIQLIETNLRENRAVYTIRYKTKIKNKDGNEQIKLVEEYFNLDQRIEVAELLSWLMLEGEFEGFNPDEIGRLYPWIPSSHFEIVMNDLRSHLVFEFYLNKPLLKFRLEIIRSYFTARYIYRKFIEKNYKKGLIYLGRYDLTKTKFGKDVLYFLKVFYSDGFIIFNDDIINEISNFHRILDKNILKIDKKEFYDAIDHILINDPPYSWYKRYLTTNLSEIDSDFKTFNNQNEWINNKLDLKIDSGVIIPSGKLTLKDKIKVNIFSFFIDKREVTNQDFFDFLNSKYVPILSNNENKKEIRFVYNKDAKYENHPLNWNVIHKSTNPEFKPFTNDYHLFDWNNGFFNVNEGTLPVTWISAYVAVIFCNWKTLKYCKTNMIPISKELDYYQIGLEKNPNSELTPFIETRSNNIGYRLPTEYEWLLVARANDENDFIWNKYENGDEIEQRKGKLLKDLLTKGATKKQSVLTSLENNFGIYGMIGNVREWASVVGTSLYKDYKIMGATWALGEHTFRYDFPGSKIPKINTNQDVGFRLAHSFSKENIKKIKIINVNRNGFNRNN
ncbi:MAG: SUMF1/EgtB/PvdO family nonheme iron enzyme [Bacteroidales bacterium]|nr:SUMF1/EgtB/PvdO family nonheme iron enzyme [Bacteroidales bacterium]